MNNSKILLIILLLLQIKVISAEVKLVFLNGKKEIYASGDVVNLKIVLKSLPVTCLDGMKQSKIFFSGLKLISETEWVESHKGIFVKNIDVEIKTVKTKTPTLTILRKVDKESLFFQEKFRLK